MKALKFGLGALVAGAVAMGQPAQATATGDSCQGSAVGAQTFNTTQALVCINEKWQAVERLPAIAYTLTIVDGSTKQVMTGIGPAGLARTFKAGEMTVASTISAIDRNVAKLIIDIENGGWAKHVETTLQFGEEAAIATDDRGREYRFKIGRGKS